MQQRAMLKVIKIIIYAEQIKIIIYVDLSQIIITFICKCVDNGTLVNVKQIKNILWFLSLNYVSLREEVMPHC